MDRALDKAWRVVATGISFAAFGLGGLALSLTVFPAMLLLIPDRTRREAAAQRTICRSFRLMLRVVAVLGVAEVDMIGAARLRTARASLIIANHPTLFDVVILLAHMDRCQCVVKHQLFRNPFLAGVVRAAGFIRNDDDPERLIGAVAAHLKAGSSVIIFPEGTRTPLGRRLGEPRRGVANIAIQAGADLIPVVVSCNHETLRKGTPWYRIPPTKIRYSLRVEDPLAIAKLIDPGLSRAQQARAITKKIRHFFMERLADDTAGN